MRYVIIILLFLAVNVSATTYYVKTDGNDESAGTSWATAWATIDKTETGMSGGDTVFFAPGIYRGQLNPVGGTATAPTWYVSGNGTDNTIPTSYTGRSSRASLWGSYDLSDSTWTLHSGNIWKLKFTPPTSVSFQSTICYTFSQINSSYDTLLHPKTSMPTSAGEIYYEDTNDTLYVWMFGNDNPNNYDTLEAAWAPPVFIGSQDHVVLYGFEIRYGHQSGVRFEGNHGDSNLVWNCWLRGFGSQNANNTSCIYSGSSGAITVDTNYVGYVTGWGNIIRSDSVSLCVNPYMTMHRYGIGFYGQQAVVVESCYIAPGFFYGIKFKGTCSFGSIRYNKIEMATEWESMSQAAIKFTTHTHFDSAYGNICIGDGQGDAFGVYIENKYDTTTSMVFMNNTFYNITRMGTLIDHPYENAQTINGNNVIKYNVYHTVVGSQNQSSSNGLFSCPNWAINTITIDSNLYYNTAGYSWCRNSTYYDSTDWKALGYDAHSYIHTDPGFNNAAAGDFSRPSASDEMNRTYGGRTWTVYGAVQPDSSQPLDAPTLISPANGTTFIVDTSQLKLIPLIWHSVTNADGYQILIANNSDFSSYPDSSLVVIDTTVTDTIFEAGGYGTAHLTDGFGTYNYWKVKVISDTCRSSVFSSTRNFYLVDEAPPVTIK
ncbi:MAG: hypothetical protein DRP47_07940 [Candidatus Zixiibacteriota bacterium]|nr:MAG: hypothetical protein DRP47_07940 [candidate division Zixibacteria bacterium]